MPRHDEEVHHSGRHHGSKPRALAQFALYLPIVALAATQGALYLSQILDSSRMGKADVLYVGTALMFGLVIYFFIYAIAGIKGHAIVPRAQVIILAVYIAALTVLQHYINGNIFLFPQPEGPKRRTNAILVWIQLCLCGALVFEEAWPDYQHQAIEI